MKPVSTTTSHLFLDVQAFALMEDGSIYRSHEDNITLEWRESDVSSQFLLVRANRILYSGRPIKEVLLYGDKSFMLVTPPNKRMVIIDELTLKNSPFWYVYFKKVGWPWQI